MSSLVGNPEDRFSQNEAHINAAIGLKLPDSFASENRNWFQLFLFAHNVRNVNDFLELGSALE